MGFTLADLTRTERRLVDTVLGGRQLDLTGAAEQTIRGSVVRALLLDGFPWPGGGAPDPRGIRLRGALIDGGLDLSDVESSLPLHLLDCRTGETIRLTGSRLSTVDLSGLVGTNVVAYEAKIERSVMLARVRLDSDSPEGTVNFGGAAIGSVLDLSGAHLTNTHPDGPAFHGNNLTTGAGLFLSDGFRAEGGGPRGTIRLSGAVLGSQLNLTAAWLVNPAGPALVADYLRTGSNLMLNRGFHAEGHHDTGTLRFVGARIGGRLVCDGGHAFTAEPGQLVLNASEVSVAGDLLLPLSFTPGLVRLDGLTYHGLPRKASLDEWLELLSLRTTHYTSQPYFQLAAAHRAAGHERDVRRIHLARERDLLRRGKLGLRGRVWHRLTGLTVGYGYRPAMALLWWLGVLVVSVLLIAGVAGPAGLVVRAGASGTCALVDQIGLALDSAAPLVKTDALQRCRLDTGVPGGQFVVAATWVLQALAWAFVTLFVAGFTGLVRKPA
ncbi:hypothetical protein ORV05_19475 [Amycolatopsis cynarae]|uniref:Oxidoreductase n=1 Tax=Amycolatopsis cynarae TaxID=2995223 RepID=A0ABY7ATD3_9PSEU|nr:hypothetical protein [Amycolatopsis sp. HUAS 11-8]WAL63212.1 hypothetical protein ORV05_19475 [Amycolatopsis sp. HUAS 11-8]